MFTSPPPQEFFDAPRPAAGRESVRLVLGSLALRLDGLDEPTVAALVRRFAPYASAGAGDAALVVQVGLEPVEHFVAPPDASPRNVQVLLRLEPGGELASYVSHRVAGRFECAGGRGDALVARTGYEPADRALENYVRAAVAWLAATRGGALVHAASAVLDGRAYLFYGESGAGKSTLSACNRRARVISDDLTLLLCDEAGRLSAVGSPFRGTYTDGPPVLGTFPLAAGFRIVKAEVAEVRPVARIRALSEFVGNLPFVAEAFSARPDLFDRIEQTLAGVPLAHLHFRKDDSYWDAILDWQRATGA